MEHRLFAGNERVYSFQKGRRVYDIRSGAMVQTERTRPFLNKAIPAGERINYVGQSHYGISQYGKTERFLITPAITVCVGVTLYHKPTATAALAHLDSNDPWLSVHVMVDHFRRLGASPEQCVARVIGGQEGYSEILIKGIINALEESKVPIMEMDLLGSNAAREIIFDSKDGIVYDNKLEVPDYRALMSQVDTTIIREIGAPIVLYNKGSL